MVCPERVVAIDQPARLRIDALGKVEGLDQRPDVVDPAVIAIHNKDKAAFVQVNEQILAVPVEKQRFVGRVVVPQIVLDFLPVPLELPGFAFERNHRIGVEIVALPVLSPEIGGWVAGAVERRVGCGVVAPRQPYAAAPKFRGSFVRPAFRILLDRFEDPPYAAGIGVHTVDLSGAGGFATARSDHQRVGCEDRRR